MIGSIKIKPFGQRGQALALAIIVVAITGLLAVPVLTLSTNVLRRSAASRTTLHEQYSVDAGTEDAIWSIAYKEGFLSKWDPYIITVNGVETSIEVKPQFVEPAPGPPPPTPSNGINILMWTELESPENLLSAEEVTITIHIQDGTGGTKPKLVRLVEVLPKGFIFVPGSLACEDPCNKLFWSADNDKGDDEHNKDDLLTIDDLNNALTVEETPCIIGCSETLEGGDPWDPEGGAPNCIDMERPDPGEDYQRLEWNWPDKDKAQIDGAEAIISFRMTVPDTLDLTELPLGDNPWVESKPNKCAGETFQAGRPLELSGSLTALITATQGKTTLTSLVEFDFTEPDPRLGIDIQSQRYGRSEEP